MAEVLLENLTKRFGPVAAVDGVDLHIRHGTFFTVVGPSAAGKTTLLRLIAGLETPDAGTIRLDGEVVNQLPAGQRGVKMVFQTHALWPHMRVFDPRRYSNLSFGLRLRRWLAERIERRVRAVSRKVGLDEKLFSRRPGELSEGEKQRVALGRAITIVPKVLLMDDPLTHLDPQSRLEVREELRLLHEDLGTTSLYVTHNLADAVALGERMAVMREGRFEQLGAPRDIVDNPSNDFVRDFIASAQVSFRI